MSLRFGDLLNNWTPPKPTSVYPKLEKKDIGYMEEVLVTRVTRQGELESADGRLMGLQGVRFPDFEDSAQARRAWTAYQVLSYLVEDKKVFVVSGEKGLYQIALSNGVNVNEYMIKMGFGE